MKRRKLILGSASPRRREILSRVTDDFTLLVSEAKEVIDPALPPEKVCLSLAMQKADALAGKIGRGDILICADTVVSLGGKVLGKPKDEEDAKQMLSFLSGKEHSVFTALVLTDGEKRVSALSEGRVKFAPMTSGQISWYVKSGEPMDKAGAYGIQGKGAAFIEGMRGDYLAVVGLSLHTLQKMLKEEFDMDLFA